ncbi:hypothetical protein CCA_00705 [Chlamydia caviae GPIC]|uniref:Uncharacterized protein n=1 Tax=Chlamydia caviae (strain ATCC VR-813 / DSM 19441 / 03DC25 / GPIC) TaxID=227941 RepID=Q822H7_CHLCV|nr:hypothetical protein CCA_00705 [Chlamydia caviae GPIC]
MGFCSSIYKQKQGAGRSKRKKILIKRGSYHVFIATSFGKRTFTKKLTIP